MTESKEQKVHHVFEKIYGNYDKMNSVISFQQHVKWRKVTMDKMKVQKGAKALDVCCGTADWTIALAQETGAKVKYTVLILVRICSKSGKKK